MIKTASEYKLSLKEYESQMRFIEDQLKKLKKSNMTKQQINIAIQPLRAFALNIKFELDEYDKIKLGDFSGFEDFSEMGRLLIALRIFKELKQKELAERLGSKESQVSRDEANEYHGASLSKIQDVLNALNVDLKISPEIKQILILKKESRSVI